MNIHPFVSSVSSYKKQYPNFDGYWILLDDELYVDYESTTFKEFIRRYLREHKLLITDLQDIPIAFGNFYRRIAFVIYNSAEINEVIDLLSNYFKKVYRSDYYGCGFFKTIH